jgi:ABC-type sugar transport system ATPase subunit
MMVGRKLLPTGRAARRPPGEIVLQASNLSTAKLRNVPFELRRGEVLGVAGLVGSGRSELGAAIFGLDRITAGSLLLAGKPYAPASPARAIAAGIGLLPEDRRLQGLMMRMSVLENATLAVLPRLHRFGLLRRELERARFAAVGRRLALHCPSPESPVSQLSGGNQQKVLLARWLLLNPEVLFLDDPTRGIDVAAKQDIYRLIEQLAAEGKAVLLVSSELPELLRCADRILVLNEGRAAASYDAREATQEMILSAATIAGPSSEARC